MEKQDIFDCIMSWRFLSPLQPFYRKYKEQLLYLFFGGLAFLVNLFTYALMELIVHHLAANIVAWVSGVLFAFWSNKKWVFQSDVKSTGGVLKELVSFSAGRLITLGLEELILWIGIDLIGMGSMFVKVVAQVVVTIVNYIISKWLVFKKGDRK